MKEKKLAITDNVAPSSPAVKSDTTEVMSEIDLSLLENEKLKMKLANLEAEVANEKLKTALSHKESAQLSYDKFVLQVAIKHKLSEGDVIDASGKIVRNS